MFDIIIIKPNEYNNETQLNDITEIVKTDEKNLLQVLISHVKPKKQISDTASIYQTQEKLYQLFHTTGNNNEKVNYLASYLTRNNNVIYGTAILLSYDVPLHNFETINSNCTLHDIKIILNNKKQHECVKIDTNGLMTKIIIIKEKFDDYVSNTHVIEYSIFKYNLIFFVKDTNILNNKVSRLLHRPVKGDVIIMSKISESQYDNLSIDEVGKMIAAANNTKLTNDDLKLEKNKNGTVIIKNKYRILENKYRKISLCSSKNI